MEEAPIANPLMTWAVSGLPYQRYQTPTPISPRLATDNPMTEPPRNATISAAWCPSFFAAAAVRTLAMVADDMPAKPAAIEHAAPVVNAAAVEVDTK